MLFCGLCSMVLLLMAKILHHLEILKLYEPLRILGLTTTHCCSFSQRSCCALFTPLPQACQGTKLPMAWYSKNRSMSSRSQSSSNICVIGICWMNESFYMVRYSTHMSTCHSWFKVIHRFQICKRRWQIKGLCGFVSIKGFAGNRTSGLEG